MLSTLNQECPKNPADMSFHIHITGEVFLVWHCLITYSDEVNPLKLSNNRIKKMYTRIKMNTEFIRQRSPIMIMPN